MNLPSDIFSRVLLGMLAFVATCTHFPSSATDYGTAELCNQGEEWLYFTRLGKSRTWLSTTAVHEGFIPIGPGNCASMVPYGMTESTIALFKQDARGVLGNFVLTPDEGTYSEEHPEYVCVRPRGAFRIFGERAALFSQYTDNCPDGFIKAKTSFTILLGGNNLTLNAKHGNSQRLRPWGVDDSKKAQRPETLREGERNKSNTYVAKDKIRERNQEAAAELLKQGANFIDGIRQAEQEKRKRKNLRYQQQRNAANQRSKEAQDSLERPSDEICSKYTPKKQYKNAEDVAVAGVYIGMPALDAHAALICNGFTIQLRQLVKYPDLNQFFAKSRNLKYTKQSSTGETSVFEFVTRYDQRVRGAVANVAVNRIYLTHQLTKTIDKKEWKLHQKRLKKQYAFGRAKKHNRTGIVVTKKMEKDGARIVRILTASPKLHPNAPSSYTISLQ